MVDSPCINVCRIKEHSDLCEGCLRTLEEIAVWKFATDEQKQAILERVAQRRAALDLLRHLPRCDD